jgi:hypothetical protein
VEALDRAPAVLAWNSLAFADIPQSLPAGPCPGDATRLIAAGRSYEGEPYACSKRETAKPDEDVFHSVQSDESRHISTATRSS